MALRHLVVILGDQLDPGGSALDGFDPARDRIWMAEVVAEATHVWSHKARIALFLSAMRHFAAALQARGWRLTYHRLGRAPGRTLGEALAADLARLRPERVIRLEAGDYRVERELGEVLERAGIDVECRRDRHFLVGVAEFARWARGRKELRMEHFYRWLRRRTGVLMRGGVPEGGRWNFDAENRAAFGRTGPGWIPEPIRFLPDAITTEVIDDVRREFADHPGALDCFDWPVTPAEAEEALADFIAHRLAGFGRHQDAMWSDRPYLYHARLSAALNLKLLDPRRVIAAAEAEYRAGRAPLAAVEGFIRQILGWREYVRGVYWLCMPEFLAQNALDAREPLPSFYWTGATELNCLKQVLGQTLALGYAHHIQRLMVTGLFALLLGVEPRRVHEWYLAVYVDAVEWVELPNTLGMSQYADGGYMTSKPYCASGQYIARMSDYCRGCRFRPAQALGDDACPITTLYWDFLARHRERFGRHPRTALQWRNLERIAPATLAAIRARAEEWRRRWRDGA
jgi:deoxyribodipyrimidine photolyase-related protein